MGRAPAADSAAAAGTGERGAPPQSGGGAQRAERSDELAFDGLEALKILLETAPELPFIMISGTVGESIAVDSIKAGASDYVMKDKLGRLVPGLAHALDAAAVRRRHRAAEAALVERLYDLPPPGERELYVGIFERPVELRPRVELRGYAARTLAEADAVSRAGAPE